MLNSNRFFQFQSWLCTASVCCGLCSVRSWWSGLPSWSTPGSVHHFCTPTPPPPTLLHAPGSMPPRRQKVSEEIFWVHMCSTSVGQNWVTWLDIIYLKYQFPLFAYWSAPFPLFIFQAKAKGQSAKVNINSALVEDIISLDELKGEMTAVLNALKDDFTRNLSIRTQSGIQLISVTIYYLRPKLF